MYPVCPARSPWEESEGSGYLACRGFSLGGLQLSEPSMKPFGVCATRQLSARPIVVSYWVGEQGRL
jgi:hypothetical protein